MGREKARLWGGAARPAAEAKGEEVLRLYPAMSPGGLDALARAQAAREAAEVAAAVVGLGARFEFDAGSVPELVDATAARYESIRSSLEG